MVRRTRKRHEFLGLSATKWAALGLFVVGGVFIGWGHQYVHGENASWHAFVTDLYANGGAELWSIAITVFIIESLNERRSIWEEKARLILQMGSPDNAFAVEAARLIYQKGWMSNGTLEGVDLVNSNLKNSSFDSFAP